MNSLQNRSFAALIAARTGELAYPAIQVTGSGDAVVPLLVAMVVRHADMADDTPPDKSRLEATKVAEVLHAELSKECEAECPFPEVFHKANVIAGEMSAYFSCLVASITPARLRAAGIGFAGVSLVSEGEMREVFGPNTLQEDGYLLTAALGSAGFRREQVRVCDLNLDKHDAALMVISRGQRSGKADAICEAARPSSPTDLLDLVRLATEDYCVAGALGAIVG